MPSIDILETRHIYELTAPVSNSKLPVLVFVHGWLLSRHYWHPLVQFLKAEYQCLIYDARGFGESQITHRLEQDNLVGGNASPRLVGTKGLPACADKLVLKEDVISEVASDISAVRNTTTHMTDAPSNGACDPPSVSPAVSETALPVKNNSNPSIKLTNGHSPAPSLHGIDRVTKSHNSNQDYSLKGYAQDLICLLESLNIEQAWLIGHSLGGSIALWAADLCPSLVQGVICLNAGGGIYLKEEFERFRNVGRQLVKFRPRWLSLVPGLDLLFARMMVARPLGIKWGRRRVIDFIQADEQAALGALLESTTESEVHSLPQLVSRLQQPVYFIAGDKDKVMETKYVNHLASFHHLFASSESNVFQLNNCGHLGMIEATEEVATIVSQVLANHLLQVD